MVAIRAIKAKEIVLTTSRTAKTISSRRTHSLSNHVLEHRIDPQISTAFFHHYSLFLTSDLPCTSRQSLLTYYTNTSTQTAEIHEPFFYLIS
jgi:hypothetical protein